MEFIYVSIILGVALCGALGALFELNRRHGRALQAGQEARRGSERRCADLEGSVSHLGAWLEALPRLTAAVRAETEPAAVGRAFVEGLGQLLPEYHTLVLGRQANGDLRGLAGHGLPDRFVRRLHEEGSGPLAALATTAEVGALEEADWRAMGRLDLMAQLRGRVTCVPLRVGDRVGGLLLVTSGRPEPLPGLHLALIQVLAGTAAAALLTDAATAAAPAAPASILPPPPPVLTVSAEARGAVGSLKANLERTFAGINTLLGADQAVDWIAVSVERTTAAPHEEKAMLGIAAGALLRGLLADGSAVYLAEGGRLVLSGHAGLEVDQLVALVRDPGEAVQRAAEQRTEASGGDIQATGHRAHLAVPIVRGQDLLGVMCGYWATPHATTSQDIAMAAIFAGLAALALDNGRLVEEMSAIVASATRIGQDREVIVAQVLTVLGALVDGRQAATANHSRRVAGYTAAIARQLGLDDARQAASRAAALVHDIGYLNAPRGVGAAHPVLGANLLVALPFLKGLVPIVLHHHEHVDGSGFPNGLAGSAIPLEARILAVANAFDVLTSPAATDRIAPLPLPEQLPCSAAQALARIQAAAGQRFDPQVVAALTTALTQPTARQDRSSPARVA